MGGSTVRAALRSRHLWLAQVGRGLSHPAVWWRMPVPVQPFPLLFAPIELVAPGELGRVVQLVLGDVGAKAMKLRIVRQLAPGDRVRVGLNGEKRDERRDGVNHLAAHLLDLKMLDGSDAAPVRIIHGRGPNPVAPDVRMRGSCSAVRLCHDEVPPRLVTSTTSCAKYTVPRGSV